jgi:hypothetical protein
MAPITLNIAQGQKNIPTLLYVEPWLSTVLVLVVGMVVAAAVHSGAHGVRGADAGVGVVAQTAAG